MQSDHLLHIAHSLRSRCGLKRECWDVVDVSRTTSQGHQIASAAIARGLADDTLQMVGRRRPGVRRLSASDAEVRPTSTSDRRTVSASPLAAGLLAAGRLRLAASSPAGLRARGAVSGVGGAGNRGRTTVSRHQV